MQENRFYKLPRQQSRAGTAGGNAGESGLRTRAKENWSLCLVGLPVWCHVFRVISIALGAWSLEHVRGLRLALTLDLEKPHRICC